MSESIPNKPNRRIFLKSAVGAAAATTIAGGYWLGTNRRVSRSAGKKVLIIGVDGMDPILCRVMMSEGLLPNLKKLSESGGFSELGTSCPPQSPVAWANFINGAGPGSHGIFDFVHRHPEDQVDQPFYSAAETLPGLGGLEVGQHKLPLEFWPFNHKAPHSVLRRQGTPFWDYLDKAGVPTTFYDLPSNYPPSPSPHGHHRCICGMGTPDMLGTYGTYQYFTEDNVQGDPDGGGKHVVVDFENDTARARITGPVHSMLKEPLPTGADLLIHRDRRTNAVALEVSGKKILLKPGQWSAWTQIKFDLSMPWFVPDKSVVGICRFYLQEVSPNFRLYVTPVNMDPSAPALQLSEPASFIQDVSKQLGLFYTTGFQEDHMARTNDVFSDDEYARQANMVLEERLALLDYAIKNYDDGLLFFYFSSSDLQSHLFWWTSDDEHPTRNPAEAQKYFGHVKKLYQKLDEVIGEIAENYARVAKIIVMSDHGFANFRYEFNLNSWLRDNNYLGPPECTSLKKDVDWSRTLAYGLGLNGLYINEKDREREGTVSPGEEKEALMMEIKTRLESLRDANDNPIIRGVYRADKVYKGPATALAPDLIVGYARGYRASWATTSGDLTTEVVLRNERVWSADHCADALEVPGVLFCNCQIRGTKPSLIDIAPSILTEFGLPVPDVMDGTNIF